MISLIVATLNRVAELERLLTSLEGQSCRDFEVIIVDQNPDDRLAPILRKHDRLALHHFRCESGASRARNVGLRTAKGDLIAFPDDDCWYPEELLATVADWFEAHSGFGVLFTTIRTADNKPTGPKWPPDGPCLCTKENTWDCGLTLNAFLRREVTDAIGFFNENIGLGVASRYQSGEDIDYLLRPLTLGVRMWYEPAMIVYHPSFHSKQRLHERTYPYALSCGYVLRVHGYSVLEFGGWLVRSLGGAFVSLCKGDIPLTYIYLLRAGGQLRGYILGPTDIKKISDSVTN